MDRGRGQGTSFLPAPSNKRKSSTQGVVAMSRIQMSRCRMTGTLLKSGMGEYLWPSEGGLMLVAKFAHRGFTMVAKEADVQNPKTGILKTETF